MHGEHLTDASTCSPRFSAASSYSSSLISNCPCGKKILSCSRYHQPYRPEAEGAWALPHGEYGLDVITRVGFLRYRQHQSLPEIHRSLCEQGLSIGARTVLNLLARYEELVTIHLTDRERLLSLMQKQGHLILALDGLRPDVGLEGAVP